MFIGILYVLCIINSLSIISFAQLDSSYAVERWRYVKFGECIGRTNIINYDFDKDGVDEIILDSGYRHLRILKYKNLDYTTIWTSKVYKDYISRFTIKDIDKDGLDDLIVLLSDGTIEEYDITSLKIKASHPTNAEYSDGFEISDLNKDGIYEYIIIRDSDFMSQPYLKIINSATFDEEFSSAKLYGKDVKAEDVDNDGADEIILSTGKVLNGVTREIEWEYNGGFGEKLFLGNIDQDPVLEIIGLLENSYVTAFDAEYKTPLWEIHVEDNLEGLHVTDYDDNGITDIIVGNWQHGNITCYRSLDRNILWQIKNPSTGATNILAADVDNDGKKEIMWGAGHTSSGQDNFFIADPLNNKIEWESKDFGGLFHIAAEDINSDNRSEIIILSHSKDSKNGSGILFIVNPETHHIESTEVPSWNGMTALFATNFDDKGTGEILYAGEYTLFVTDALTHNIIFKYTFPSFPLISSIIVEDVDKDNIKEIVVGDLNGYITIFDSKTFKQEWMSVYTGGSIGKIIIDNCDEDISPEIIFFNSTNLLNSELRIQVYDGMTHYLEWQSPMMPKISTIDVADIDMDGVKEFIAGFNDGRIIVLNSKTHEIESEYKLFDEAIYSVVAANLDSSNGLEILTGTSHLSVFDGKDFTKKWESGFLGERIGIGENILVKDIDHDGYNDIVASGVWGIFHYEADSKYPDRTSGNIADTDHLPERYSLLQNYPNPFNPSTTIEYQLTEASDIKIQIFNIMGELVETLVATYQAAGYYKTTWNANNSSSGVYFCRISAGAGNSIFIESKKIIFLK